ncbi:MAG: hypothetical protein HY855_01475 [Burkholderiales bacterium]|nr:hypothetical protein [Burkholderiales bacterium]
MLPFTRAQFLAVFVDYNTAIWPAQWLAVALGLALVLLLWRAPSDGGRWVGLGLAAMWAWTGVAYHGLFFAAINPAAGLFGGLFVVQALLLAHAALRAGLRFGPGSHGAAAVGQPRHMHRWLGWALVLYALLLYPLIGTVSGHAYPELPMFGVTPCPVTLFTVGVLLLAELPLPRRLLVVPLLWTLVGGSAAWLLGIVQDWPLLASAPVLLWLGLVARRPAVPANA